MTDPSLCIREMSGAMKRGAFVLISTPNLLTIPPHPLSTEHVCYLSPLKLTGICKNYGLVRRQHIGTSFKFPLVRLGNRFNFFYWIYDQVTKAFRNHIRYFTQTIAKSFERIEPFIIAVGV